MATNKHALIRYQALDRCFSNSGRRYYIENLIEECNKALSAQTGSLDGVKERQVRQDINDMESIWDMPLTKVRDGKKVYYCYSDPHYSINKQPLNATEISQLQETIIMLNRFKGMPQFDWMQEILVRFESTFKLRGATKSIVGFEQNPYLKGLDLFSDIFNAIINKQTINVHYQKFGNMPKDYLIHPYFLKQYNNRWFLFALSSRSGDGHNAIISLALDRIGHISFANTPYIENSNIEFDEYFDDVIGVTVYDKTVEQVLLEIDNVLYPYIETKPLHGSQKIKERNEKTTTIELSLIINYELENLLLAHIDKIKIVAPELLRLKMLGRIKEALAKNE